MGGVMRRAGPLAVVATCRSRCVVRLPAQVAIGSRCPTMCRPGSLRWARPPVARICRIIGSCGGVR